MDRLKTCLVQHLVLVGQPTRQMRNRDVNIEYGLTFEELFTGKTVNIQYRLPSGRIEILDAAVPPGVKQGDK